METTQFEDDFAVDEDGNFLDGRLRQDANEENDSAAVFDEIVNQPAREDANTDNSPSDNDTQPSYVDDTAQISAACDSYTKTEAAGKFSGGDNWTFETRVAMARVFIDTLYSGVIDTHYSYLWIKRGNVKETIAFDVGNVVTREAMAKAAIKYSDENFDVYIGICLTDSPPSKNERVKAGIVTVQTSVWCDLDCVGGKHTDTNKYFHSADTAVKALPLLPSLVVNSGYGVHAHCVLSTPLFFTNDIERENAKARNKAYLDTIRARAGQYKHAVDSVQDLPRVLRVPGTYNFKLPETPAKVCLIDGNDVRYTIDEIDAVIGDSGLNFDNPNDNASDNQTANQSARNDGNVKKHTQNALLRDSIPLDDKEIHRRVDFANSCLDGFSSLYMCGDLSNYANDHSRADMALMSRLVWLFNGDRAVIESVFSQSALGKRDKWIQRQDYRAMTIDKAIAGWDGSHYMPHRGDGDSKELLDFLDKQLADEESAAVDFIRNFNDFTADKVFDKNTLQALAFVCLADTELFGNFKAQCQKANIGVRDLNTQLKPLIESIKKRRAVLERRHKNLTTVDFFNDNDICKNLLPMPNYWIDEDGVFYVTPKGERQLTHYPVVVTEQFINLDTKTFCYRLAFKIGTQWKHTPIIDAEIIADARKLIQLSCYGFEVNSCNAAQLTGFFAEFIAVNRKQITKCLRVPRAGWHTVEGKDYYILPNRKNVVKYHGEDVEVVVEDSAIANALTQHGNVDEWKNLYLRVKQYPIARLVTAAAIAPCLLKTLHERSFCLYIWALTRSGKSTALKFAASAMGDPERLFHSMDATLNAIEGQANEHNHLALILDEKQQLDPKMDASQFAYKLANEMSRNRMSRDAKLKTQYTWRIIAIMTGEVPFLNDNTTGGAATRVLSIHSKDAVLSDEICAKIHNTVNEHYGFALPAVIDLLHSFKQADFKQLRDIFVEECLQYSEDVLPEYLRYLSTICLADMLLNMALFGVNQNEAMADAKTLLKAILPLLQTKAEISDAEREKDFLKSEIAANIHRFVCSSDSNKVPPEYWGTIKDGYCYIMSNRLTKLCKENGFNKKKLVDDLLRDGFIKPADKADGTVRPYINGLQIRCYRIPIDSLKCKTYA